MSIARLEGLLLDWADTQVSAAYAAAGELQMRLSAARVTCAPGTLAQAPEETEGYLAPVLLRWRQARWQGELALAMGRLSGGELWVDGQRLPRLPLPCECTAPVRARLAFAHGLVLEIEAEALVGALSGAEKFTPVLAC
jgi:hypothetical protein